MKTPWSVEQCSNDDKRPVQRVAFLYAGTSVHATDCRRCLPRHTDRGSTAAATALRIPALGVRRLVLAEVRALATLRAAATACRLLDAYRHVDAPRRHSPH